MFYWSRRPKLMQRGSFVFSFNPRSRDSHSHRIHVWYNIYIYIYLHLVDFYGTYKQTYRSSHGSYVWDCGLQIGLADFTQLLNPRVAIQASNSKGSQGYHSFPWKSGWWFQPIWKKLVKLGIFPKFRGENIKYLKPPPRYSGTLKYPKPEANSKFAPENGGFQCRNLLFQGSIFRCKLLVSGRVVQVKYMLGKMNRV